MASTEDVVFLFDEDNTLLDNDRVRSDLRRYLVKKQFHIVLFDSVEHAQTPRGEAR